MKIPLLVVRWSVVAIPLIHLAIFLSYFVPYMDDPRVSLWQALLLPWNGLFAYSRAPFILVASIMFVPLLLPPIASWTVFRSPVKMIGLVSVWISIPLLFVACFFWVVLALELYVPVSGLQGILRLVIFFPSLGFALALLLCLGLARCQRLLLASEKAAFFVSQPELPASAPDEQAGHSPLSAEEPQHVNAGAGRFLLGLTIPGLLCYLLVLVSLSFPYTNTYDPYTSATWDTTGWQMLGQKSPSVLIGIFLLAIPLLPVLTLLLCRIPISFLNIRKDALFLKSISLSYWLHTLCFILSSIILEYSLLFIGASFKQEMHWLYATPGIPSAALLLALICSGVLRSHFLRRIRA